MKTAFLILFIILLFSIVSSLHAQNPIQDIIVNEDPGFVRIADLNEVFEGVLEGNELVFMFVNAPDGLNMDIDWNGILFFNPDENYNLPDGVDIVVVAEDEEGMMAEVVFNLVIRPVNDPPVVVEPVWDIEVNEDPGRVDVADLDEVFFDVDGDELTFNLRDAPDEINMVIDEDNILFFDPDRGFFLEEGVRITVRAEDPDGAAVEDRFTLVINPVQGGDRPIVVGPIPDIRVNEDPGRVDVADLDNVFEDVNGEELMYTIVDAPEQLNMNINWENILFFNPDENYNLPGGVEITVAAENFEAVTEDIFNLVIRPVNDAPEVVEPIDDFIAVEDAGVIVIADLDDVFFDVDGDELSFGFGGGVDELNIDIDEQNNLFFDSEPNFNLPDGTDITVTAEDQAGETAEDVFNLAIRPVNDAPFVVQRIDDFVSEERRGEGWRFGAQIDDVGVDEDPGRVDIVDLDDVFIQIDGEEWVDYVADLNEVFFDIENDDELTFSFDGAPEELNMEIDEDDILSFSPEQEYVLPNGVEISVTAEDPEGLTAEDRFFLIVWPVHDAPPRDDCGQLDYEIAGAPNELNMNIDGNEILFFDPDPNFNIPDGVEISIIGVTEEGRMLFTDFILIIRPVNDAPVWINAPEEIGAQAGEMVEFTLAANDVDLDLEGDDLTLRITDDDGTGELGAEFIDNEDNTGDFSWQTDAGENGVYNLVFEVEDQNGLSAEIAITLTLSELLRELAVPIHHGWNMISINVTPPEEMWERDEGPDVILMTEQLRIDDDNHHLSLLKDEDGRFYLPEFGFNNIPYWNLVEGYLIKVDEDVEACWSGEPIPTDADIPLEREWNLIAYYPTYELDASAPDYFVLSPIIDNVLIAKDGDGNFMLPAFNFSNMPPWRETQGYQVRVDEDVILNYPAEQEELVFARNVATKQSLSFELSAGLLHFVRNDRTGENMSVLITGITGTQPHAGDQIGAFNSDGESVGIGTIDSDSRCGLAVWGDDESTEEKDGLSEGETFELKYWDSANDIEVNLDVVVTTAGKRLVYGTDSFLVIVVDRKAEIPLEYYLNQNYPNPFNNITQIKFGLPEDGNVSLRVYDISGRFVCVLIDGQVVAGHHTIEWDAEIVSSGLYIARLESLGGVHNLKMMLVK